MPLISRDTLWFCIIFFNTLLLNCGFAEYFLREFGEHMGLVMREKKKKKKKKKSGNTGDDEEERKK